MLNIAVLVSGGGTNLQAIIDSVEAGKINGKIVAVISNNANAYALERAKKHNIDSFVSKNDDEILDYLKSKNTDIVVLAGYLRVVGENLINAYEDKIINVHPSLIPSFCGKGYYGLKVHQSALDYGVKVTGATVHYVNNTIDGGKIIAQKAVEIKEDDTAESLQKRVMEQAEWVILPQVLSDLCK